MDPKLSNALYHAKEVDQGLKIVIEGFEHHKHHELVRDFLGVLRPLKTQSSRVIESLESINNQEKR